MEQAKSHDEIQEQSLFMRDYNRDNNPGSFELPFYQFHCTEIDFNGHTSFFKNSKIIKKIESSTKQGGSITFELDQILDEYFSDENGNLQPSSLGVWVDIVTSVAVSGFDPEGRLVHVSANLSLDLVREVKTGQKLKFKAFVWKIDKNIALTHTEIFGEDGELIASSEHKKAFINPRAKM